MKKCFKCGKEKELDEFYKHPQTADGHFGKCKECTRKDVRQNRSDKIEQYRAYDRFRYETQPHRKEALAKRYKTEAYKESRKKAHLKERNNSIKIAARNLLTNAIRDRRIKKGFCELCGSVESIEGHHDDYCYPLTVRWLCHKCHYKYHKELRNKNRPSFKDFK